MKSQEINPEKKFWFVVLSCFTFLIVFSGWFFSFRDLWHSTNLSFRFNRLTEVKQGLGNITTDFKEGVQEDTAVIEPVLEQATAEILEQKKQEEAAKEVVGEIMKDNLNNSGEEIAPETNQVSPAVDGGATSN